MLLESASITKASSNTINRKQQRTNQSWIRFFTLLSNTVKKRYLQKLKWCKVGIAHLKGTSKNRLIA
jgi:hypothetical protein